MKLLLVVTLYIELRVIKIEHIFILAEIKVHVAAQTAQSD